jgi:hypothetical protein
MVATLANIEGQITTQVGVRTSQTPVPVIRSTMNVAQKWAP